MEAHFGDGVEKRVGELASSAPKAPALRSRHPTQPTASASSAPATETALLASGSPHNARGALTFGGAHSATALEKRVGELASSAPKAKALISCYPTQLPTWGPCAPARETVLLASGSFANALKFP